MKFFYGEESYLIAKELKKIKDQYDLEPIYYNDLSLTENIISELSTVSLFNQKKLIILKNIIAFNKEKEAEFLIKELKTIDITENIIVFVYEGMPNKTNKLFKFLEKNADTKKCNKISDRNIHKTIEDIVNSKGGSISPSASIALADKLPNDLRTIIQEIDKLLIETNSIEKEHIEISIGDYQNDNIFALSNALSSNSKKEIVKAYREKLSHGEEPITIISQMASVYNLVYKVMVYQRQGYSPKDTATDLGIHIFRVQKSLDIINTRSEDKIKDIIIRLSDLDKDIKTGKIDPKIGMDNLILNLIK